MFTIETEHSLSQLLLLPAAGFQFPEMKSQSSHLLPAAAQRCWGLKAAKAFLMQWGGIGIRSGSHSYGYPVSSLRRLSGSTVDTWSEVSTTEVHVTNLTDFFFLVVKRAWIWKGCQNFPDLQKYQLVSSSDRVRVQSLLCLLKVYSTTKYIYVLLPGSSQHGSRAFKRIEAVWTAHALLSIATAILIC